jgi:Arc/MetJ family transcription regulator
MPYSMLKGRTDMRTTINIDEELLPEAAKLAGPLDRSALLREGLKALVERESARRLARLGASQPDLKAVQRRRPQAVRLVRSIRSINNKE